MQMAPIGEDPRWEAFGLFHDYLLKAFPLVCAYSLPSTASGALKFHH